MSQSTVFVVDDDEGVREALRWLIESVHLKVETYESADDFLAAYDPRRPGCLVLDVRLPGTSGLELLQQQSAQEAPLPIIIVTGHADVPMCIRAFGNGAFAFVQKPINNQALLEHIHRALAADAERRHALMLHPRLQSRLSKLTPREREVMELLVNGKSLKQIAARLQIGVPTASKHRARVLEKLCVTNDVSLVRLILGRPSQSANPPVSH